MSFEREALRRRQSRSAACLRSQTCASGCSPGGADSGSFASFGDPRRPVLDFDLLARKRHRAQKLKTLVRTILTFGPAGDGLVGDDLAGNDLEGSRPEGSHLEGSHLEKSHSAGAGHGLLYVLAVDNGKPFGLRRTACKFGITGKRLESRRRFHELRLGIRGSEEMRLCYLAAGSVVAAEKIVRRRTARKAPPGLRPWSEWRWCAPRWLVRQVKAAARGEIRAETDRLGLDLTYQCRLRVENHVAAGGLRGLTKSSPKNRPWRHG